MHNFVFIIYLQCYEHKAGRWLQLKLDVRRGVLCQVLRFEFSVVKVEWPSSSCVKYTKPRIHRFVGDFQEPRGIWNANRVARRGSRKKRMLFVRTCKYPENQFTYNQSGVFLQHCHPYGLPALISSKLSGHRY